MTATVVWILDKIITAIIFQSHNTKEQALLLNKSNNKITNLEKEKEQHTKFTPIFQKKHPTKGETKHGSLGLIKNKQFPIHLHHHT